MSAVLELGVCSKVYPGEVPVVALDAVDLVVEAGERIALVGASGSGKTTLLALLGTLERPTSGVVTVLGHDVASLRDRDLSGIRANRIGFVFQRFFLLEHQSVLDNVLQGLLYRGAGSGRGGGGGRNRREAALKALDRVGLSGRTAHRPSQLSGGERQRVAIARAVAGRPAVILADEPTGNLDSVNGAAIVALLLELSSDGTTVVVATHDPDVAAAMEREVVMRDGRIVSDTRAVPPGGPGGNSCPPTGGRRTGCESPRVVGHSGEVADDWRAVPR